MERYAVEINGVRIGDARIDKDQLSLSIEIDAARVSSILADLQAAGNKKPKAVALADYIKSELVKAINNTEVDESKISVQLPDWIEELCNLAQEGYRNV